MIGWDRYAIPPDSLKDKKMDSLFKIGDYVKVLPRTSESGCYRCGFVDDMAKLEGQVFQVIEVHEHGSRQHFNIPDDGCVYTLANAGGWSWPSGMLEMYKHEEPKEKEATFSVGDIVEILPREGKAYDYTNPYVTAMDMYVGHYAIITSVDKPAYPSTKKDDGYAYHLNVDDGKWFWNSTALKKCSVKTQFDCGPFDCGETSISLSSDTSSKIKVSHKKYKLDFNI